jgi:hypothetical protein
LASVSCYTIENEWPSLRSMTGRALFARQRRR